jgi:hypothetical protein
MAADQVELLGALGFERFAVVGPRPPDRRRGAFRADHR